MELFLLHLWQLALEYACQYFALCGTDGALLLVFFNNEVVNDVAVNACETCLLELLLEKADECHIQLAIHQQHVVALVLGILNETVLLLLVVRVEVYYVALLVGLLGAYKVLVLLIGVLVAVSILQKRELVCLVIEILLGEHSIVDENLEVVPLLLELLAVVLENLCQTVRYLL